MKFVQCTPTDVATLQQISRETFYDTFVGTTPEEDMANFLDEAYAEEKLVAELRNPQSTFYFLRNDKEQVVAYLKINVGDAQTEDMGEDTLEVERIYVRKAYQKQGLGKLLMNEAFKQAELKHKKNVWLGVWEHNTNAIAFYEKKGFQKFSEHAFVIGDDTQIDWLMKCAVE